MKQDVFYYLKLKCREQGITYKEIARRMDLSEATIKRIFSTSSCHMDQFHELCEVLNTHPSEVYSRSKATLRDLKLSRELEEYFLENMHVFLFYRQLRFAGKPEILRKRHKLTHKSIKAYLEELKRLGLIEIGQKNKVEFCYSKTIEPLRSGKLIKKMREDWMPYFMENVEANQSKADHMLETFSLSLTPHSMEKFKRRILDLKEEMFEQSEKDRRVMDEDKGVGLLWAIGPYRMAIDGDIPEWGR